MTRGRKAQQPPSAAAQPPGSAALWLLAITLCVGLRAVAAFAPSNWVWGLDTAHVWPLAGVLALGVVAAVAFVPGLALPLDRALSRVGAAWERGGVRADLLAAAIVAVGLWPLRDPVQFVGDFALRVGTLARNLPSRDLFPQAFPLDLAINVAVPRALMGSGLSAADALQVVGCVMAGLFTWAGLAFIRGAGASRAGLPVGAVLLLGGGWLPHFAGYDKFGPLLLAWTLVGLGLVRMARGGGPWWLAAGAAMALLSHRAGFLVLPCVAVALATTGASRPAARTSVAIAAILIGGVAAVMAARAWQLFTGVDMAVHIAPSVAEAQRASATLRVTDAVNALFFTAPLWPIGAAAVALGALRARHPDRRMLAPAAAVALVVHGASLLVVRAGQGSARDWDIFTVPGLVFGLATIHALIVTWQRPEGGAVRNAVVAATIAAAVFLWAGNLSAPLQIRRVMAHVNAPPPWTDAQRTQTLDFLGFVAFNQRDFAAAASRFEEAARIAPNPRYIHEAALAHLGAGDTTAARIAAWRVLSRDPRRGDTWWVLAAVAQRSGDAAGASAYVDSARARGAPRPPPGLE